MSDQGGSSTSSMGSNDYQLTSPSEMEDLLKDIDLDSFSPVWVEKFVILLGILKIKMKWPKLFAQNKINIQYFYFISNNAVNSLKYTFLKLLICKVCIRIKLINE